MTAFRSFSEEVSARLDERETDQDMLIHQAMPLVGQHMADMEKVMAAEVRKVFREVLKVKGDVLQVGNNVGDFLDRKVHWLKYAICSFKAPILIAVQVYFKLTPSN